MGTPPLLEGWDPVDMAEESPIAAIKPKSGDLSDLSRKRFSSPLLSEPPTKRQELAVEDSPIKNRLRNNKSTSGQDDRQSGTGRPRNENRVKKT